MNDFAVFELKDDSELWYEDILKNHYDEALSRAHSIIAAATANEDGCLVTATLKPKKLRFLGRQDRAYRFVFCVLNKHAASWEEVVRHRCHNRLCVNPEHLDIGSRADNKRDDWDYRANGFDAGWL